MNVPAWPTMTVASMPCARIQMGHIPVAVRMDSRVTVSTAQVKNAFDFKMNINSSPTNIHVQYHCILRLKPFCVGVTKLHVTYLFTTGYLRFCSLVSA